MFIEGTSYAHPCTTIEAGAMPEVVELKGNEEGPRVGIMALCHGNEPAGLYAQEAILRELSYQGKSHRGTIVLIKANTEAYEQNVRYIDSDLNRMFCNDIEMPNCYEGLVAKNLKHVLRDLDYLLDVHTTSKNSHPFVACISNSFEHRRIALDFPVDYSTFNWESFLFGMSIEWVEKNGGLGFILECGQHENEESFEIAQRSALAFLNSIGVMKSNIRYIKRPEMIYITSSSEVSDHKTFEFCRDLSGFERIRSNEVIAVDANEVYRAPGSKGLRIVMPSEIEQIRKGISRDAFFVGQSFQAVTDGIRLDHRHEVASRRVAVFEGIRARYGDSEHYGQ